jgi:hypothetical protein
LEEDMADDWKKVWWIIGTRSGEWLEEDMADDWKKVWWIIGTRSGEWLDKIWRMIGRRSVG